MPLSLSKNLQLNELPFYLIKNSLDMFLLG